MGRSMSLKEDLNQSLQGRANGELFISSNVSDELFPLVYTFDTMENKSQTGSFVQELNTSHNPDAEPVETETAKPWELMTRYEEQREGKYMQQEAQLLLLPPPEVVECADFNMTKRSKSCHWSFPEHEVLSLALGISNGVKEAGFNWSNNGIVRCRSFHSVEEYDAMVERIWSSRLQQTGFDDDDDAVTRILLHHSETSSKESHHADHTDSDIQALDQWCQSNKHSAKENPRTEETGVLLTSALETKEVILSTSSSCSTAGDVEGGHNTFEKEPKRKAIAKQLRSLRIPSTVEFPAIASLREWLPMEGQIYSPGANVTPKFGSYALPIAGTENECSASVPFSPELVAAFEESMKQLEAEEESILNQIAEQLEEDCTNEMEPKG